MKVTDFKNLVCKNTFAQYLEFVEMEKNNFLDPNIAFLSEELMYNIRIELRENFYEQIISFFQYRFIDRKGASILFEEDKIAITNLHNFLKRALQEEKDTLCTLKNVLVSYEEKPSNSETTFVSNSYLYYNALVKLMMERTDYYNAKYTLVEAHEKGYHIILPTQYDPAKKLDDLKQVKGFAKRLERCRKNT